MLLRRQYEIKQENARCRKRSSTDAVASQAQTPVIAVVPPASKAPEQCFAMPKDTVAHQTRLRGIPDDAAAQR